MDHPHALVLVDGSNLHHQTRTLGERLDVTTLRGWASAYGHPDVHWFQGAYPHAVGFLNVVRSTGIRVHARIPKTLPDGTVKADMDTDLVAFGVEQVLAGEVDTLVLVSGDGDFEPLVRIADREGLRVVVVSRRSHLDPALVQYVEPGDVVDPIEITDSFRFGPVAA